MSDVKEVGIRKLYPSKCRVSHARRDNSLIRIARQKDPQGFINLGGSFVFICHRGGGKRRGQGTADQMLEWTQRSVEARLAAATNHQERLDALRDGLKVAQDREKDMEGRQRAGIATPSDLITAKYMRIQAELALANEQGRS